MGSAGPIRPNEISVGLHNSLGPAVDAPPGEAGDCLGGIGGTCADIVFVAIMQIPYTYNLILGLYTYLNGQ